MKSFRKFLAASLAALMLAGCGGDTSWVYRDGDYSVPPGLYTIYQINGFSQAEQTLAEERTGDTAYTSPSVKELLKATIGGQPVPDYINEKAKEGIAELVAVRQEFEKRGLSLTEAELASIDGSLVQIKAQAGDFYTSNGVSDTSLKEYYMGIARKGNLFLSMYGEGGDSAVPTETLKNHFKEKYALIDIALLEIPQALPEGETKTLEEIQAAVRAEAQAYADRVKAGETMEQITYEIDLSYAASEEDKASIQKPEEGELTMIMSDVSRATYGDAIVDAALKAQIGTPVTLEEGSIIIIFNRKDVLADETLFDTYRATLLQELKGEEYTAIIAELANAVQIESNQAALNKYKPARIKFDEQYS